jgi:hypothetical protein
MKDILLHNEWSFKLYGTIKNNYTKNIPFILDIGGR